MRGLGNVVARLTAARRSMAAATANEDGPLDDLIGFGSNPGELDARLFMPAGEPKALVVVLHGCTQNASVYDNGSGWSTLAARAGFAVLFPQQRRSNNPNLCFNWYQPSDARRGRGEALSIAQMVRHVAAEHGFKRSQVFITGLSAGGAMTSVMLACYPDLFAAGAIIAGLPFASANNLPEALERMRGQGSPARYELAARLRTASGRDFAQPAISVWHGSQDRIVAPSNATAIVDQWRDAHGLGDRAGKVDAVDGHRRETWRDERGHIQVERYDVGGMGHGTPLDTRDGEACGTVGPHMLEAGICSTRVIAASWGLVAKRTGRSAPVQLPLNAKTPSAPANHVGAVIEDALRAAGLMR